MKRLIMLARYLLTSGHTVQPGDRELCTARSMCLGCDGKLNCHLAKVLHRGMPQA